MICGDTAFMLMLAYTAADEYVRSGYVYAVGNGYVQSRQ